MNKIWLERDKRGRENSESEGEETRECDIGVYAQVRKGGNDLH